MMWMMMIMNDVDDDDYDDGDDDDHVMMIYSRSHVIFLEALTSYHLYTRPMISLPLLYCMYFIFFMYFMYSMYCSLTTSCCCIYCM
jgi:hypothetical protein